MNNTVSSKGHKLKSSSVKTKKLRIKPTKGKKGRAGSLRFPNGKIASIIIICGHPKAKQLINGGIGAYLMLFSIMWAKDSGYDKIIFGSNK